MTKVTFKIVKPAADCKRACWKYTNVDVTDAAIYFLVAGDRLVTCWTGEKGSVPPWPTTFATDTVGGGKYLVVWKREQIPKRDVSK